jgi:hypothetical protein
MRFIFEILIVAMIVGGVVSFAGDRFDINAISQRVTEEWNVLQNSRPIPNVSEVEAEPHTEQIEQDTHAESVISSHETSADLVAEHNRLEDPVLPEPAGVVPEVTEGTAPAKTEFRQPALQPLEHSEVTRVLKRLGRVSRMAARGESERSRMTGARP